MSGKDRETTERVSAENMSVRPPPYGEDDQAIQAPPEYSALESATNLSQTCRPHCPYPPVIHAHNTWKTWKSFKLHDASSDQELFYVGIHTGYGGTAPLGTRPGLILRNGTKSTDPVLGASGDESQMSASFYTFCNTSVLTLPAFEPGPNYVKMDTERMRGAPSEEHGSIFSYSIEVGEKEHRGKFEWRKFKQTGKGSPRKCSFWLVRLPSRSHTREPASGSTATQGERVDTEDAQVVSIRTSEEETIALITIVPPLITFTNLFTLEFLGSALTGELGDRCMLMIVLTAMRLYFLNYNGRTTKAFNTTAVKVRSEKHG